METQSQETINVIPVVEEFVNVGHTVKEIGKTVILKTLEEEEVNVELTSSKDELEIEHIPIKKYVDTVPEARQEGNVTIIPVLKEVVVVEKKMMLVEEIRITKNTPKNNIRRLSI